MNKRIIAIGGGELKNRETLAIDEYIAGEAKRKAEGRVGLQTAAGGVIFALPVDKTAGISAIETLVESEKKDEEKEEKKSEKKGDHAE